MKPPENAPAAVNTAENALAAVNTAENDPAPNTNENGVAALLKTDRRILLGAAVLAALSLTFFLMAGCEQAAEGETGDYTVYGNLKSESVDLNSKIAGTIQEILVAEGDQVQTGDILIVIDSANLEAKRLQAEGALAAANATYKKALAGARSQDVVKARLALDLADKTYQRVLQLYEEGAVSENDYDQAYAQYLAAEQTYSLALEGAQEEDVNAAYALVLQAQGALAEVDSYLADCNIKASMDGVVSSVNVSPGELVSTGMPLASISNRSDYWIEVNVEETRLSLVKMGGPVEVVFAAYPEESFSGTVIKVDERPSFATKKATNSGSFDVLSYLVKVSFDNDGRTLYPGMTAAVTFPHTTE